MWLTCSNGFNWTYRAMSYMLYIKQLENNGNYQRARKYSCSSGTTSTGAETWMRSQKGNLASQTSCVV